MLVERPFVILNGLSVAHFAYRFLQFEKIRSYLE